MTKLLLFFCLLGVSFALEDEGDDRPLFQPKTWTGPGVLPLQFHGNNLHRRSYVPAFGLPDVSGLMSHRRRSAEIPLMRTFRFLPRRRLMRRTLHGLFNTDDVASPIFSRRALKKNSEDPEPLDIPTVPIPATNNVNPSVEPSPNWSGMLSSLSAGANRRSMPSETANEENSETENINNNPQTEGSPVEEANDDIDEPPPPPVLVPKRSTTHGDYNKWNNPDCHCVERVSYPTIVASRRSLGSSGPEIIYLRRQISTVECTCLSQVVAQIIPRGFSDPSEQLHSDPEDDVHEQVKK